MSERKVHRFGVKGQGGDRMYRTSRTRLSHKTLCGLCMPETPRPKDPVAVDDQAFRWLPHRVRCVRCYLNKPSLLSIHPNEIERHLTTVETIVLAIARLGEQMRTTPHRCWFTSVAFFADDNGVRVNTAILFQPMTTCCGSPSWTDPRRWEWAIASVLARAAEKYCYPHWCSACGYRFSTDRPRGAIALCNPCRIGRDARRVSADGVTLVVAEEQAPEWPQ